jgi:hypothetical protein
MICCRISTTEDYRKVPMAHAFTPEKQKVATQSQIGRIHSIIESARAILDKDEDFF